MKLRDYQQLTLDELYAWFNEHAHGNPCIVAPTGSGKSHILAALCENAIKAWPATRILMLTHQRELIEQDAEKLLLHWPNAPLGVYCSGMNKRELGEPITFASVQSIRKRANQIGHIDLLLVDESHRINNKQEGGYRSLITDLAAINPAMRVVGLSATPFRLGQGYITDGAHAIFHDLIEPVTISYLVDKGYLSTLRSKATHMKIDTSGVRHRGGEFVESELQARANTTLNNKQAVDEIIKRGEVRHSLLLFCTGVAHAKAVQEQLRESGINAACVTGDTPKRERDQILSDFKSGALRAVTNCDVLTTGFDHTGIDLIALLRPTESPGLYMQMVGRGMRIDSSKQDCLILDFAGNVERHGPITAVNPPKKPGEQGSDAPVKTCPECDELVHASIMVCPECGYVWPKPKHQYKLSDLDIMGADRALTMQITRWEWTKHTSRSSGKEMLKVKYYGALSDPVVNEYLCITHSGYAGRKAMQTMADMARHCGADTSLALLDHIAGSFNACAPPGEIHYMKDGKFYRIADRIWSSEDDERRIYQTG